MSLVNELKRRNVLRVAAAYLVVGWLLTEVLTTILPTLGAPEWMARAVILIFAFGFIPTVILSWVYEITPEGIKREKDLNRDPADDRGKVKKLDYITIAGVILAIVFFASFSARQPPDEDLVAELTISNESVAVLPFVNMSKNDDNEYFSDGLTETLLHMLAQYPDLKVAARTSSFAFKGKNKDIREIANALQVAHILEGSVQQVGDRVRITVQLIRAVDGFHVWSEIYDRTIDDIFAIQDEIAIKVGGALSASILGPAGGGKVASISTSDLDAYDLYLQARRERATFSFGGLLAAEELLKGALTIDPDFLEAKNELATNYLDQANTGLMNQKDAFTTAIAITDQVLSVRPADAAARAIQLFVELSSFSGSDDSNAVFKKLLELENIVAEHPAEYQARVQLTQVLQSLQQPEKALRLQLDALERDPYNPRIFFEIGSLYRELGQLDDARTALNTSIEIEPNQPNAYLRLAMIALLEGDGIDFLRQNLKSLAVDPRDHEIPGFIAAFLYQLGLIAEGDDFQRRVNAIAPTSEIAYRIELLRAINTFDEEGSLASARRAIEDDIDDRQFAYGGAVQYLLRYAARTGTVVQVSDYLERQAPGILDMDADPIPNKFRNAQQVAFDAWYTTLSHEELMRRLDKALEFATRFGIDIKDDPEVHVRVLVMQGEIDQAIDIAIADFFTQPVINHLGWRDEFALAQFSEFNQDPRIIAAMQNWEKEEEALRDGVRSFLADLSSS